MVTKGNPYHLPAGSPGGTGGEFTSKAQTNTSHGDGVEGDADRADVKAKIVAHFKKTGRAPNYDSVGGYDKADPAFNELIKEGKIKSVDYLSPKGRRLSKWTLA